METEEERRRRERYRQLGVDIDAPASSSEKPRVGLKEQYKAQFGIDPVSPQTEGGAPSTVPEGTPSIWPPTPGDDFEDRIAPGLREREAGNQFLLEQFRDLVRAPERGSALDFPGGKLLEFLGDAAQVAFLPLDAFGETVAQAGQARPGPVSFGARAKAFTERPISEQIGFGLIDPAFPLGIGRAIGSTARSLFRGSRFAKAAPFSRVSPAAPTAPRPFSQLADAERTVRGSTPEARVRAIMDAPVETVPEQIGTGQAGFGIGEAPRQGELLSPARGPDSVPLIDADDLAAQAGRRDEIARGQTEFPEEILEDIPDTRLERANQALFEADAECEGVFTRGRPAARFGTPEFAEAAAEGQRLASEGKPLCSGSCASVCGPGC